MITTRRRSQMMESKNRSPLGGAGLLVLCLAMSSAAWATEPLEETTFAPDYPSGANYDVFTATLFGFGLLPNGAENRCDTNGVAGAQIAAATTSAIKTLEYACAAIPGDDVGGDSICWGAILIDAIVEFAALEVLEQCNFQDSLIDSAEIEAAYENTVEINSNLVIHDGHLEDHDAALAQHDVDVKLLLMGIQDGVDLLLDRQLEVIRLLHTPQGRRQTEVPACEGAGCDFPDR
jgi:hypothetical protein